MKLSYSSFQNKTLIIGAGYLIALTCLLIGTATAEQKSSVSELHKPLSQMKLRAGEGSTYEYFIGLTSNGAALIASRNSADKTTDHLYTWNVRHRRALNKTPITKWIDLYSSRLSPDGQLLITNNNRLDLSFPKVRAYRMATLRTSDLKVAATFKVKPGEDTVGYLFTPNDNQHVVAKVLSEIRGKKTGRVGMGRDRFDWLNVKTGKVDKTTYYNPARGCDRILYSKDRKYLVCLFTDESFDYVDDKREQKGIVDVLDEKTGKILWHIKGTLSRPAGEPFFFISPTQFVSSNTIFDIKTKTAKPWSVASNSRPCLSEVPGHSSYALFMTQKGLQLRNWRKNVAVATWPTVTTPGRIYFSPDLNFFAYKRDNLIEFWSFDSKWLT